MLKSFNETYFYQGYVSLVVSLIVKKSLDNDFQLFPIVPGEHSPARNSLILSSFSIATAMHIIIIVTIAAFAVPKNQIIFEMITFFAQLQFALRSLSSFLGSFIQIFLALGSLVSEAIFYTNPDLSFVQEFKHL